MALQLLREVSLSQNWALYNTLKNWTLYNLSEVEVQLLLQTLNENELKLAKVCRKGDSKWENVIGLVSSQLLNPDHKAPYSKSEGYPDSELKGDSNTDTDIRKVKDDKIKQPRQHNRKEVAVSCKIANAQGKEFITDTHDLSEGGLHFKQVIPDWIAGYFIVLVEGKFELMCSIVEDQKEKTRVQIVSEDNDPQYLHYKEWLQLL